MGKDEVNVNGDSRTANHGKDDAPSVRRPTSFGSVKDGSRHVATLTATVAADDEDEEGSKVQGRVKGRGYKETKVTEFFPNKKNRTRPGGSTAADAQSLEKARERKQRASQQAEQREDDEREHDEHMHSPSIEQEQKDAPTMAHTLDDINAGAALLQLLATDNMASGKFESRPKPPGRASISDACARLSEEPTASTPPVVNPTDSGEGWAWEPSCHTGLLTYHDGRKRWYHCTQCKYFNDRLYHSKMHYQRIHVNQGKSMPRKRKYMEPAGTSMVAGEAACLPPQHVQQPEPKYSRTRQPGDKWLKTVANKDTASSGFRYQSVKDQSILKLEEDSAASNNHSDDDGGPQPSTPSDDCVMPAAERERTERELRLSTPEKKLYCWELTEDSIKRGIDKGGICRKFKSVYTFQDHAAAAAAPQDATAAAPAAAALRHQGPTAALAIMPSCLQVPTLNGLMALAMGSKQQTWWWHNQRATSGSGDTETEEDDWLPQNSQHAHTETPSGTNPSKPLAGKPEAGTAAAAVAAQSRHRASAKLAGEIAAGCHADASSGASSQETVVSSQQAQDEVLACIHTIALAAFGTSGEHERPGDASRVRGAGPGKSDKIDGDTSVMDPARAAPAALSSQGDGGRKKGAAREAKSNKADATKTKGAGHVPSAGVSSAAVPALSTTTAGTSHTSAEALLHAQTLVSVAVSPLDAKTSAADEHASNDSGKPGISSKRKGAISGACAVAPAIGAAGGSIGGIVGGGGGAEKGNLGTTSAHGKKRVWRRWGPAEEEALQRAVEKHGTKDWMAIVQEMQTDRSVKQLQDHWNDTKNDRKNTSRT